MPRDSNFKSLKNLADDSEEKLSVLTTSLYDSERSSNLGHLFRYLPDSQ